MGCCDTLGVIIFNTLLVLFTLPSYLVAVFSVCCEKCKKMGPSSCRSKTVLFLTGMAWRIVLGLCCWICRDIEGYSEFKRMGSSGRPVVIVSNHASFMDTIMLVALFPLCKLTKVKMFVSSHLLKMPLLGTICYTMGHLAVPFKATGNEGGFELDKDKMAERQQQLEDHVKSGGTAGWFPEGKMAPEPEGPDVKVGQFRAGGFTLACNVDCEIWCCSYHGITTCWPTKSAVGGRPARIGIKLFRLCESSNAFREAAGKTDVKSGSIYIANEAQAAVQRGVDELRSKRGKGLEKPLLA